jgi:lipoprotein-anchoring transpeptidase ErfK/SrfK
MRFSASVVFRAFTLFPTFSFYRHAGRPARALRIPAGYRERLKMRGRTGGNPGVLQDLHRISGPEGVPEAKAERLMSLRIAVALAATIGAGMLVTTGAEARPDVVGFRGDYSPGTIVVKTNERRLYLVVDQGHAVRYPVGVGKAGKQWAGITRIDGKYRNPAWSPPAEVKHDKPSMPNVIPGGSPQNPMGVAAMTLAGGEYAIHGTNMPGSVGGFVSYGCIRMLNADITDLYQRVSVGTTVVVSR